MCAYVCSVCSSVNLSHECWKIQYSFSLSLLQYSSRMLKNTNTCTGTHTGQPFPSALLLAYCNFWLFFRLSSVCTEGDVCMWCCVCVLFTTFFCCFLNECNIFFSFSFHSNTWNTFFTLSRHGIVVSWAPVVVLFVSVLVLQPSCWCFMLGAFFLSSHSLSFPLSCSLFCLSHTYFRSKYVLSAASKRCETKYLYARIVSKREREKSIWWMDGTKACVQKCKRMLSLSVCSA